jgi:hypothetical protein
MKFLTREWATGDLTDKASDDRLAAYRKHTKAVRSLLPQKIRSFSMLSLHDGLIKFSTIHMDTRILELCLRCGDLQVGYSDIGIEYHGVDFKQSKLTDFRKSVLSKKTEILYDEFDIGSDGLIKHSYSFTPKYECEIVFRSLEFKRKMVADRKFVPVADKYKIIK